MGIGPRLELRDRHPATPPDHFLTRARRSCRFRARPGAVNGFSIRTQLGSKWATSPVTTMAPRASAAVEAPA
jgi:hypothetical protein